MACCCGQSSRSQRRSPRSKGNRCVAFASASARTSVYTNPISPDLGEVLKDINGKAVTDLKDPAGKVIKVSKANTLQPNGLWPTPMAAGCSTSTLPPTEPLCFVGLGSNLLVRDGGYAGTVILMHIRGTPEDHIKFARYNNVVGEVMRFLAERARFAIARGIARSRIILDPGIGFAKNAVHNLELLRNLPRICTLGYPVLIGASRKSFIRRIAGASDEQLSFGTAAVDAIAIFNGASIVRVHEPGRARAVVAMAAAISTGNFTDRIA